MPVEEITSPCIGVCTMGPGNLCIGCFRTAEEIGAWLNYSPEQRQQIMQLLPQRLESLFAS